MDPNSRDPFNVYSSDSWRSLLAYTESQSDLIRMRSPEWIPVHPDYHRFFQERRYEKGESRYRELTINCSGRTLRSLDRRDRDLDTRWTVEPLLKGQEDLEAFLSLPDELFQFEWSYDEIEAEEKRLGEDGIVMIEFGDPLSWGAGLFEFGEYTVCALTSPGLFHRLLEKLALPIYRGCQRVSEKLPERLWRIYGPEYASEPYLPPRLFREYVNRYTGKMIEILHENRSYARLHSHGRLRGILPAIAEMKPDALDPLEPPEQGDIDLKTIAREYGQEMVLFGNIEISELIQLDELSFKRRVYNCLEAGDGAKGHVLMPSSSPFGRAIDPRCRRNYEIMRESVNDF